MTANPTTNNIDKHPPNIVSYEAYPLNLRVGCAANISDLRIKFLAKFFNNFIASIKFLINKL
jgi:hypothetical protein